MKSDDPFTLCEDALWAALEHHPDVTALVRPSNRRRFTGSDNNPIRENVSTSDMPELMMFPVGGDINPPGSGFSADSFAIVQRYALAVTSGTIRTSNDTGPDAGINPIKWACFKALMRAITTQQADGGFLNLPFVRRPWVGSYTDGVVDATPDGTDRRLPIGWRAVLDVSVTMVLPRKFVTG